MKIATWNVNSINVRLTHVLDWLAQSGTDILALQETKTIDEKFPQAAIIEAGYQVVYSGQKTYNGTAIISKQKANDIMTDIPQLSDPQRRILVATVGDIRVVNLYVPNGSAVGSDKYAYKLDWLAKMRDFLQTQLSQYPNLVVLGDFNIAPEDRDVHDPEEWRDRILCSQAERDALQALLDLGLVDSFRLFEQAEQSFSWWDYRMAGFRRNHGLRIDHILLSNNLRKKCQAVDIDKNPRKLERPSDHAPVVAHLIG